MRRRSRCNHWGGVSSEEVDRAYEYLIALGRSTGSAPSANRPGAMARTPAISSSRGPTVGDRVLQLSTAKRPPRSNSRGQIAHWTDRLSGRAFPRRGCRAQASLTALWSPPMAQPGVLHQRLGRRFTVSAIRSST
jgi:hypothetical protein